MYRRCPNDFNALGESCPQYFQIPAMSMSSGTHCPCGTESYSAFSRLAPVASCLEFGRIVVLEIEAPNMLVNLI